MKLFSKKNSNKQLDDNSTEIYVQLFLGKNELKTRQCVYVSQKMHKIISEIVRVIANREVTVGGYIDNIIEEHLKYYMKEINDLYKKEKENLIEQLS